MSVYMGIDWSAKKHDIVILNEAGAIITPYHAKTLKIAVKRTLRYLHPSRV